MSSNFSRAYAAQPHYLRGRIVTVEIDITRGLHSFNIVGLPDKAVEEARDRVGSAIKNSGFQSPKQKNEKLIVSLAPADLKKEGSFFDLAIALGYLLSSGDIVFNPNGKLFMGELSLNGELLPIRGALPLAQIALDEGFTELYVPAVNAREAALVAGVTVYPVKTLREVIDHLHEPLGEPALTQKIPPSPVTTIPRSQKKHVLDFSDIKSQELAKRGLEIAAAGGHNVAMYGPPGTGKTMLARAFAGILPNLSIDESLEVTGIHSIAGILEAEVVTDPAFRSPHHTASYVSIIGGGAVPKPGEVTLAHRGVLFLDEFPEFDKRVLESLRQPLEDRVVHISRAGGSAKFPANFILVAAMNPCPCGFRGSRHKTCTCNPGAIERYQRKVSGPIMDRIDLWLEVEHVDYEKLSTSDGSIGEKSEPIRQRIDGARSIQYTRFGKTNSNLSAKDLERVVLEREVKDILNQSAKKLSLSPRAYHRVIKLARTIADLDEKETIESSHVLEALQYRPRNAL